MNKTIYINHINPSSAKNMGSVMKRNLAFKDKKYQNNTVSHKDLPNNGKDLT